MHYNAVTVWLFLCWCGLLAVCTTTATAIDANSDTRDRTLMTLAIDADVLALADLSQEQASAVIEAAKEFVLERGTHLYAVNSAIVGAAAHERRLARLVRSGRASATQLADWAIAANALSSTQDALGEIIDEFDTVMSRATQGQGQLIQSVMNNRRADRRFSLELLIEPRTAHAWHELREAADRLMTQREPSAWATRVWAEFQTLEVQRARSALRSKGTMYRTLWNNMMAE